mgnify:CR=1 FL=1
MSELIFHILPVIIATLSFWANTEKKVLLLNLGLCITLGILWALQSAWGGALVVTVAGFSTAYRLIKAQKMSQRYTALTIILLTSAIGVINHITGATGWLEILPVITFIFYRYGELHCDEKGLRICMVAGSAIFALYGVITHTWGAALTEALFVLSNGWFLLQRHRLAVAAGRS